FAFDFPLGVGLLLRLALVEELFSLGDRQLDLGQAALEVNAERYESEATFGSLAGEASNLAAVQQQFARPLRLVIHAIPHRVFRDIAAQQPDLTAVDLGVGVLQAGAALAQALDLGSCQDQPTLQRLEDLVVVQRALVATDRLDTLGIFILLSR